MALSLIAKAETVQAQRELLKAFENKQLNGVAIRVVKRLIDSRRLFGKKTGGQPHALPPRSLGTAERMVSAYKRESQRQRDIIRKARFCETQLVFIVSALNELLGNDTFVKLLEKEGLAEMPECLWSKLNHKLKAVA